MDLFERTVDFLVGGVNCQIFFMFTPIGGRFPF